MIPIVPLIATLAPKIIERLLPDKQARDTALLKLQSTEVKADLERDMNELVPLLTETQSKDRYVSRVRPTFLYLIYGMIIFMLAAALIGIFWPQHVMQLALNMKTLLHAIPEDMWWLFGAGYLGYTGARSYDKRKKGWK